MVGYEDYYPFLGKNLFNQEDVGYTVFSDTHNYYYRRGEYLLEYPKLVKNTDLFKIDRQQVKTPVDNPDLKIKMDKEFKIYMTGLTKWLEIQQRL